MNLEIIAVISLILAAIPCGLFLVNLSIYRPLPKGKASRAVRVSVLIPARNEEHNIHDALNAVLENRGVEFEVIVLDDHSTDKTVKIVSMMSAFDSRVRLETAPPLPAGWCGKQHACNVLAQRARHSLLVFIDADVRLAPDALTRMAGFMEQGDVALASGVPRQELGTFSERLLIPLIHFILLGFLPMRIMRRTKSPAFSAGCGQLFITQREAYQACGGHAQIKNSLHDGIKLPREFRRAGFRTDLFDATDVATCRMYHTNAETWRGLGKNATEGLAAPAAIIPMTVILLFGQIIPFVLVFLSAPGSRAFDLTAVTCGLALLPRLLAVPRFRQSWLGALLHPVGVLFLLGIQWHALLRKFFGQPMQWKGRNYLSLKKHSNTSVARLILVIIGAAILNEIQVHAGPEQTVMTTNLVCPSFELMDQFETNHVVSFPRKQPLILIVADRKGSEQIEAWVTAIKTHYSGRLEMIGVADVSGVPGWMQNTIRKKFQKKYAYPIFLDWSGKLPALLHCQKDVANVFLLNQIGHVLVIERNECDKKSLYRVTQTVDQVVQLN